jgi:hypothetical protein
VQKIVLYACIGAAKPETACKVSAIDGWNNCHSLIPPARSSSLEVDDDNIHAWIENFA